MREVTYANAPVRVRGDLPTAHQNAWRRLAEAGTWWAGSERVAIAAEARNAERCRLCRQREATPAANAREGEHDSLGALPEAAVEVIHRLACTPARLSRTWFEKVLASGLSDAEYVELVSVVATLVSIDGFCRALGVPPHPLPEPVPGEPSRYRPPQALPEGAWVPMIARDRASGREADLYQGGRTGNVLRALSLVPDEVRALRELSAAHYLSFEQMLDLRAGRSLDRQQIELLAGRVSALNECFY
jgi:alkylhydroperoxidase family enzyme